MTTNLNPIKTKADYHKALEEIYHLMEAKPNTPDGNRLERLSILVEAYEEKHFPIIFD